MQQFSHDTKLKHLTVSRIKPIPGNANEKKRQVEAY